MKKGTLIIVQKDKGWIALVKRADGHEIKLDIMVTPEIQKLNGKPCEYHLKGDKVVIVEGKNIFSQKKQEVAIPEKTLKDPYIV